MGLELLKAFTVTLDNTIRVSINKDNTDIGRIIDLVNDISDILDCMSVISNRGFVDSHFVHFPFIIWYVEEFACDSVEVDYDKLSSEEIKRQEDLCNQFVDTTVKEFIKERNKHKILIRKKKKKVISKKSDDYYRFNRVYNKRLLPLSRGLNILFYNTVLMLLYNAIIKIENIFSVEIKGYLVLRYKLEILRVNIFRRINPNIRSKISNKGLSVLLKTVDGFDSEYVFKSSMEMKNDLLSIQLADNTGMVLKIPLVDHTHLTPKDLRCSIFPGEKRILDHLLRTIHFCVFEIRELLFSGSANNDDFIKNLLFKLDNSGIKNSVIGDYKVYLLPLSDVKQLIKFVERNESEK